MVTLHIYHASMVGAVKGLNLVLPKKVMGGVCPLHSNQSVSLESSDCHEIKRYSPA